MNTDPRIEDTLDNNPLIAFSVYTHIQSGIVRQLGRDVLECFDGDVPLGKGAVCVVKDPSRCYGQFWLWVIGAYEVVRTMCQAKQCFLPGTTEELKQLKQNLTLIRMPFTKQEMPGKSVPVQFEASIHGISHTPPDLKFEVKGNILTARNLINEFERVFSSIRRADILADHRTTYPQSP